MRDIKLSSCYIKNRMNKPIFASYQENKNLYLEKYTVKISIYIENEEIYTRKSIICMPFMTNMLGQSAHNSRLQNCGSFRLRPYFILW